MTFDVTRTIPDYKGEPVVLGDKDATWRDIIFNALNSTAPDEALSVDQRVKAYQLTKKSFDSDTPDFSVEERAFILERIKAIYLTPIVIGRALEAFDSE